MDKILTVLQQLLENQWFVFIFILILIVLIIYISIKYKLKLAQEIFKNVIIEVENRFFGPNQGAKKLETAIIKIKTKMPWYLRVLPIEKLVIKLIEISVKELKEELSMIKIQQKEIVEKSVGRVIDLAIETPYRGNSNLISNNQLYQLKDEVQKDPRGFVEGRITTDLKNDTRVEVAAGIKF